MHPAELQLHPAGTALPASPPSTARGRERQRHRWGGADEPRGAGEQGEDASARRERVGGDSGGASRRHTQQHCRRTSSAPHYRRTPPFTARQRRRRRHRRGGADELRGARGREAAELTRQGQAGEDGGGAPNCITAAPRWPRGQNGARPWPGFDVRWYSNARTPHAEGRPGEVKKQMEGDSDRLCGGCARAVAALSSSGGTGVARR